MERTLRRCARGITAALAVALFLSGCAYRPVVRIAAPTGASLTEGQSWWAARYRHAWPEGEEPRWHQDIFVAHEIVQPVLDAHRGEIVLWRFHRRAARDGAWHQFTFFFYAPAHTAARVFADLRSRPGLADLKSAGLLREDVYHGAGLPESQRVEGTSDRNWPPVVQATWPWFIMGVSEHWLALVALEFARRPPPASPGIDERIQASREVSAAVDAIWRREGFHAYLHHLNAVFGYIPLLTPAGEERAF
jgi:hypothetical protein